MSPVLRLVLTIYNRFWYVYIRILWNIGVALLPLMNLQVVKHGVEQNHDHQANDGAHNYVASLLRIQRAFR